MKKFVSDLVKKEVMTSDGELIGIVDNFVIDTDSGEIRTVLVKTSGSVTLQSFQKDSKGRYMIPLMSMKSFKDVFVVDNSRSMSVQ
ncbi:hypothetical protein IX51_08430 [uncultured archaeon]|nr:hypothetical protein IX51_08430 [uncultured archaeon]